MKKRWLPLLLLVLLSLVYGTTALAAHGKKAKAAGKVIALTPDDIQWKEGPPNMPNVKMAVLEGNPKKKGFFVMRLKVPAGTKIPPHVHDNIERVTVISGAVKLAMGEKAENPLLLPAGSYFSIPPRIVHNAWVDQETVLQIATNGPWSLRRVDGAKDGGKMR